MRGNESISGRLFSTRFKNCVLCLVLIFSMAGCQPNEQAAEVEQTQSPPTLIPTIEITDTPLPTSTPTQTPEVELSLPRISLSVPAGSPVVLDGEISPDEWDQASVALFEDGSELLLMHANGFLYLAVRSATPDMIVGNIYLQRGDQVSVLHSSAALGTAKFSWQAGVWKRVQNFTWRCRNSGSSEAAQTAREEFLQQEGWVAANARMGTPNELEYKIALTESISAMAVNILQELEPNPFPAGLDDDCVQAFPGGIPEEMQFSIEDWVKLDLAEN